MNTVDNAKMIARRVSKGYNKAESIEKLEEVLSISMAPDVFVCTLLYWDFITVRTAEKMMREVA